MAYAAGSRQSTLSLGARLGEIINAIREAAEARRVYRRTLAELQALSSRELNDLGLNSTTIRQAAYEAAYGAKA